MSSSDSVSDAPPQKRDMAAPFSSLRRSAQPPSQSCKGRFRAHQSTRRLLANTLVQSLCPADAAMQALS